MLHLIGALGAGGCTYKSVEFDGELVSGLSISERMTMANLAMEMGVKCVFTPTDDKAEAYLVERSSRPYEPIVADADAHYAQTIDVDGASIVPMVACPHEVDNMMENVTKRVCQIHSRAEPLGKAE